MEGNQLHEMIISEDFGEEKKREDRKSWSSWPLSIPERDRPEFRDRLYSKSAGQADATNIPTAVPPPGDLHFLCDNVGHPEWYTDPSFT